MPRVMTMGGLSDCGCSSAPSSATGVSGRRRHKGRRAGSFRGLGGKISNAPPGLTQAHRPAGVGNTKYTCRKVRGKWHCTPKKKRRKR